MEVEKQLFKGIDAQNIEVLMNAFYPKVLANDTLLPLYQRRCGKTLDTSPWKAHIKAVIEYWKMTDLGYEEETKNPVHPDFNLPNITRTSYDVWLQLFNETIDELYESFAADYLKDKNQKLTEVFMKRAGL